MMMSGELAFTLTPARRYHIDLKRLSSNLNHIRSLGMTNSKVDGANTWSERDATWLQEANVIEYVVGSGSPQFGLLQESLGLNISSELGSRNIIPHHLTTPSDLFCNRELTMSQIEAVGFDMDWTLAQYNEAFDLLAYNGAKEKLVSWLGYPTVVLDLIYRQDMYRRGCVIDKKRGNILKLDRHRYVRYAEHGLTEISADERKTLYRQNHEGIQDMSSSNHANTDTPFSLVDACLFAQLVDIKDKTGDADPGALFMAGKSYESLWSDMRKCVDRCHKDGVIKKTVALNPEKYITYDPNSEFPTLPIPLDSCLSIGLSVCLSICLSVCLSVHLSPLHHQHSISISITIAWEL